MMRQDAKAQVLEAVVILGASRGIGRATALELARRGAAELHLVARTRKDLESLAREISAFSPQTRTRIFCVDLMQEASLDGLFHAFEDLPEFPRHWVLNVGGRLKGPWTTGPFESFAWSEIESQLRFNLELPAKIVHRILPELLRPREDANENSNSARALQGSLIFLSSQAAYGPRSGTAAYAAAKAGLSSLASSLYVELREKRIRVSLVSPGMVDTPLHAESPRLDRSKMIGADDVASAIAWILECDPRTCPYEIHLRPQQDPLANF
jgi:short-subunit dehydrogenase